jgi:type I restriction enzyme S subunit
VSGLPPGWLITNLEEVTTSRGGGTPSKDVPAYWHNGKIPWVSPKDMKTFIISASEDHVTDAALDHLSVIPKSSVLLVVRSGILSRTVPVAVTSVPVTVNQDIRAFTPEAGVDARYVAWQIVAKEREVLGTSSKHGTTVASLEGPALARFPLWLAPTGEQSRIVAKLEELLSDLDAGVAELRIAQKKLAQYRQTLLTSAVEGSLTGDWREKHTPNETGDQLLQRIITERRARWEAKQLAKYTAQGKAPLKDWRKKYVEPVSPETTNLPELPGGWVWATIDQISRVGTGVTPLRSKSAYYKDGNVPWVTSGALNSELVESTKEFVTQLALKECRLEIFPPGSLLVAMYGEGKTRGKCSELQFPSTINQAIAAIVLEPLAQSFKGYVKSFLLESYERMRAQASGGVQPNLNLQIIKSIALPLPPDPEQVEITQVLDVQFELIRHQQAAIELGLKQAAAQRQNLLRAAFAGDLVPQDPNDEQASALLRRIRAKRAEQAKQPKVRKTPQQNEISAMLRRLIDVLAESGDWVAAQEAFRRCGVTDGSQTDKVEVLYAELRALDKAGRLAVEAVADAKGRKLHDRLKLLAD